MSEQYLSVGQVNNYIKNIFEAEVMLQNICIYGEVSSYKISNNIAYFNLTDETGLISCVLFNASRFPEPNIGDVILAVGSVSYYAKGGKLSFNANHIAPYGKGLLYEKFLKLKEDLEKRGYFKLEHKKPIPERVNKIGVVTSSTGAVIQDIINVTKRRNKTVNIVLYPVKVQGVGAETEIANGINFFSNYDGSPMKNWSKTYIKFLKEIGLYIDNDNEPRPPYSLRHYYATQRLLDEVSIYDLAKNMGTSVKQIEQHYGHIKTVNKTKELIQKAKKSKRQRREELGARWWLSEISAEQLIEESKKLEDDF